MQKDNTEGSQLGTDNAYIAGFLDGDGSIMLQVKKRSDTKRGFRFMATICFYQDSRHDLPLRWIRQRLGIGYIFKRNDGMTELRINGFASVGRVLSDLRPYIRFKLLQAEAMLAACQILSRGVNVLSNDELFVLVELILTVQQENYSSRHKKSRDELLRVLGLTPYRLDKPGRPPICGTDSRRRKSLSVNTPLPSAGVVPDR